MTIAPFDEALLHHAGAVDRFAALSPSELARAGEDKAFLRELATLGSLTVDELARLTRTDERYVHDWLAIQALQGRVSYSPRTQRYSLTRPDLSSRS